MAEEVVNPIVPEEVVNPVVHAVIHAPAQLVFINPAAQLPLKLTPNNYPAWRAQVLSLLQGYNLLGYVNGNIPQPPAIVTQNGVESPNPNHTHWVQQDQLLLHSLFASLSEPLIAYIASSTSSRDAWDRLTRLYANRSRSRTLKSIADQLALVGAPLQEDDLILHCLNGIGPEFKEISGVVRVREQPISFEALHDKLVEYEDFLKRNSPQGGLTPITANFTQKNSFGHNKPGSLNIITTETTRCNKINLNKHGHSLNKPTNLET
ncbi:hypothetical protein L484_006992 [Morus notabilis]|uniref:Uncharacterized protein n=1 Tax=Morus notabilis TaxID=981085 RepID=W9S6E9_9ROSA|nr:hypothetical protein L484_006992 [Morus notabilis]